MSSGRSTSRRLHGESANRPRHATEDEQDEDESKQRIPLHERFTIALYD